MGIAIFIPFCSKFSIFTVFFILTEHYLCYLKFSFFIHALIFSSIIQLFVVQPLSRMGSGCGSVGRTVTSKSRGPRFQSSHQKNLY